jgi:hypothetical protein
MAERPISPSAIPFWVRLKIKKKQHIALRFSPEGVYDD